MIVGFPASSPAAVVPHPPWCTTALTRRKSQLCGASSMNMTDSDFDEAFGSRPPHPRARIALTPVRRTASKTIFVACFGSRPKMLPNPKYTGGAPVGLRPPSVPPAGHRAKRARREQGRWIYTTEPDLPLALRSREEEPVLVLVEKPVTRHNRFPCPIFRRWNDISTESIQHREGPSIRKPHPETGAVRVHSLLFTPLSYFPAH